jgi:hypothetical protein
MIDRDRATSLRLSRELATRRLKAGNLAKQVGYATGYADTGYLKLGARY